MVFPIYDQGMKIHTPKNQVLQRPSIRQTQATSASRRLVDQENGTAEHEQSISDQTWLGRNLLPKEKSSKDRREEEASAALGVRALKSYTEVDQSRKPRVPHLPASQVMSSPVITLSSTALINDAWQLCQEESIHYIVLLNTDGRVTGVISDRNLLAEAAGVGLFSEQDDINLAEVELQQLVQAPLLTAQADTDVREIARLMLKNKVRAVPVLNSQKQLVGLVTRSNLMLGLANQSIEINT